MVITNLLFCIIAYEKWRWELGNEKREMSSERWSLGNEKWALREGRWEMGK